MRPSIISILKNFFIATFEWLVILFRCTLYTAYFYCYIDCNTSNHIFSGTRHYVIASLSLCVSFRYFFEIEKWIYLTVRWCGNVCARTFTSARAYLVGHDKNDNNIDIKTAHRSINDSKYRHRQSNEMPFATMDCGHYLLFISRLNSVGLNSVAIFLISFFIA